MNRCIIRGPRACFARIENPDKFSYPIITPSAVEGIVTRIFSHPGLFADVRQIWVLNPIRFVNVGRALRDNFVNHHNGKILCGKGEKYTTVETWLVDPKWLVEFEWKSFPKKHCTRWKKVPDAAFTGDLAKATAIFGRRIERGEFYYPPSLGQHQFRALVEPVRGDEKPIRQSRDFGMVLHGIDFRTKPVTPYVFDAAMINGIVDVPSFYEILKEAA